jgi:putative acetyltransferase
VDRRKLGSLARGPSGPASRQQRKKSESVRFLAHTLGVNVEISPEPIMSPDAQALIAALNEELTGPYPPDNNFFELLPESVDGERGIFVIARVDNAAVGCGAVRLLDDAAAEIKRMYVPPEQRGRGVAGRLLEELEAWARERDVRRLVLETGDKQHEAIALYERAGFTAIPCWGEYAGSETSICYEKRLR